MAPADSWIARAGAPPFQGRPQPEQPRREAVTVFVMARLRGDRTDSMRGSLRAGPHGWDAAYTLNGGLYGRSGLRKRRGHAPTRRLIRTHSGSWLDTGPISAERLI
jgi:hypothetical protein